MNICLLTPNFYMEVEETHGKDRIVFGGAERYLYELYKTITAMGHNFTVFQCMPTPQGKRGIGTVVKNYRGMTVICIENNEAWQFGVNPSLNMAFNELTQSADLRIYYTTYAAYPYALKPCISICHGIWWDYPYYMYNTCSDEQRREFFDKNFYGFTAPDVCVSVDSNVKKVLQAMKAGADQNIEVIYNFVDTDVFKPRDFPRYWEKPRVLFPRRLTSLRGCNEFIAASQKFGQYEYLAVGQAADEAREKEMQAFSATQKNIRFKHVEMDGMETVYQESDIAVVPTKSTEGLSLSLLEAMATGLPVITTPVGGLGDAVIAGYNALICDIHRANLGEYIDYLAKSPDLWEKFGKRNRDIAVECFDIEIWRQRWQVLLRQFE